MIDLKKKESDILSGLKDFQLATVERVCHLFTIGFSRILVADEVGLGKTLIARGTIAKIARYHKEVLNDELFKVVYVCSNQSIAGQNLDKLKIDDNVTMDGLSDTRLSMQHLKIFENNNNPSIKENYIQLIPLTPSTSFNMTIGCGSVRERALIYAILKRYNGLKSCLKGLEVLLMDRAPKDWGYWAREYDQKVLKCDKASNGEYLKLMLEKVQAYFTDKETLLLGIIEVCHKIKSAGYNRINGVNSIIHKLRKMMADISVDLMDADLVIMDEFQRFPELIDTGDDNETAILAKKFFNCSSVNDEKVKILLLSATPYKLYSTLEEINETQNDEHYKEFMQVTDFIFEDTPMLKAEFKNVWSNFSIALGEATSNNFALIAAKKQLAEDYLYKGICRTERTLVDGASELVDIELENGQLNVTEDDVLAYVETDLMLNDIGLKDRVPVEYIKSAPFILSFMEHYKFKQKIFDFFKHNPDKIKIAKKQRLWLNREVISKYDEIAITNARLAKLKDISLPNNAEKLMWVPPSKPYYEFGGCFAEHKEFSKVLVFSAWEMVPRAIAAMISYEAERLTVGNLVKNTPNNEKENRSYFAKNRFPSPRLKFNMRDNAPANMTFLCLLYPSITMARLFNPIEVVNRKLSLKDLMEELKVKIEELLSKLDYISKEDSSRQDDSWYYIAPLLFDLNEDNIKSWFENPDLSQEVEQDEGIENEEDDKGAYIKHFEELKRIYFSNDKPVLGRKPKDLTDVLVSMVLGSPSICALRMFSPDVKGATTYAVKLARTILDRFNAQEATAIIELDYGMQNKDAYWQNVLKYCLHGNIQAMLDEYAHLLLEGHDLNHSNLEYRNEQLAKIMIKTFKTHTASYNVDTFDTFKARIYNSNKKENKDKEKYIKMRSSYAVGFYDTKNEGKSVQRKDNIRLSFNSPFRPFVLATTSIGQEGLDFHYYCRKIVHWNLPSNPIDLEQREGRINRYKCLAIRQNIANKYGNINFGTDIWREMFEEANRLEKNSDNCELVPFWCLPDNQQVKIERIVPMYPLSKDGAKYERLIKILSLYRLSLGQARQEELLEYLFENNIEEEELKQLFMNLSPFYKDKI
jgi:hypothetical protein